MIKRSLLAVILIGVLSLQAVQPVRADEATLPWQGTVTAVDSNGNRPGRSFTAVDAGGKIKVFYISTLSNLKVGSRVELHYLPSDKYPLVVTRIRFLQPAQQ